MVRKCVVCGERQRTHSLYSFHAFPKNKSRRNSWIKSCYLNENIIDDWTIICSKHFKEDDFDYTIWPRRTLLPTATPFPSLDYKKPISSTSKDPKKIVSTAGSSSQLDGVRKDVQKKSSTVEHQYTVRVENKFGLSKDNLNMVDFEECISLSLINKIKCELCGVMCLSNEKYKFHVLKHKEKHFKCNLCKTTYDEPNELTCHMYYSHGGCGNNIHLCDTCGECFTSERSWQIHVRIHTMANPYVCPVCKKVFALVSMLESHMTVHDVKNIFGCTQCTLKFTSKKAQINHFQQHARDERKTREFTYSIVDGTGMGKVVKANTNSHSNRPQLHLAKNKNICKLCGEKFVIHSELHVCGRRKETEIAENHKTESNEALQPTGTDASDSDVSHMDCSAEDVKPIKCECSAVFFSENEYKIHIKDDCEVFKSAAEFVQDFNAETNVKEELDISVESVKKECEDSCETANSNSEIVEELTANDVPAVEELEGWEQADDVKQAKRTQRSRLKCPFCNKSYTREAYLRAHVKQHTEESTPLKCDICDMVTVFKRKQSLKRHMLIHQKDRKMYSCDICGKVFKVYNSVRVHKINKHPRECFQCEHCGETLQHEMENHVCRYENEEELSENHNIESNGVIQPAEADFSERVCKICHADCSVEGLETHMLTHDVKPFKCECFGVFFSESEYKKHLKNDCKVTKSSFDFVQDIKVENVIKEELEMCVEEIKEEGDS